MPFGRILVLVVSITSGGRVSPLVCCYNDGIGIGITGALLDILVKWCALNFPRDRLDLTSFLDGQAK